MAPTGSIIRTSKVISKVWVTSFIVVPFLMIMLLTFLSRGTYGGVQWEISFDAWTKFFSLEFLEIVGPPFQRSFLMALATTFLCLALAYPFSLYLRAQKLRWQGIMLLTIMMPFWTNFLVRIYAWMALLSDNGWINEMLGLIGVTPIKILYTPVAVLCGMVYNYFPYMLLPVYVSVEKLDMTQVDAARDLGAKPLRLFLKIIFPQIAPGVFAGSLLVFVPAFGEFAIPDILGGATNSYVGNLIAQQFTTSRNWPLGGVLSTITLAFSLLIYFSSKRHQKEMPL